MSEKDQLLEEWEHEEDELEDGFENYDSNHTNSDESDTVEESKQ